MLRLPASLERRLAELFPRTEDREQFVADAVEQALLPYAQEEDDQPHSVGGTLHLFSDGGSRGNPGQAAFAYIIEDPVRGVVLKEHGETIGIETNNVAEYRGLIEGLKAAKRFHPNRLICHLDSELVVRQLNGEYRVKMPTLVPFFDEIRDLTADMPDVVFVHIPREDNYRADALVNRALDSAPRPSAPKRPPPTGFTGRLFLLLLGLFGFSSLLPSAHAAPPSLTYRFRHFLFTLPPAAMRDWETEEEQWLYRGQPVTPPAELRVDGDRVPLLPDGFVRTVRRGWDTGAIARTLETRIAASLDRENGNVTIARNASGSIVFTGEGFPGRHLDLAAAARLTAHALEEEVDDITLPVAEMQPAITVLDPELRRQGIRELVAIGESDFSGSTKNRIHNVTVGLRRFNGHLIASGSVFSFDEVLGRVDASTGYRKELTIIGERTLPDYGGGLCQVSTTAYRGVWEYGFPILQRKNHSFAVHYYAPQGTDATVYPPAVDMRFKNDSPGALLIQTVIDVPHTKAAFLYYGTRDDRGAEIIGPFVWDRKSAPPPRTEETTEIPPGTTRKVGEAVPGMQAEWYRIVERDGQEKIEGVHSHYQARPHFTQIGVSALSTGSGSLTEAPGEEAALSN